MKKRHQRPNQSAGVLRRLKKQGGQAIVLLALTGTLLIGGVGIAAVQGARVAGDYRREAKFRD